MMEVEEVQADRRTFVSCAGDAEAKKGSAAATQRVGQRVYWRWPGCHEGRWCGEGT